MLSILHPSRQRPKQAFDAMRRWTSSCGEDFEYILSLDIDDPTKHEYFDLFQSLELNHLIICNSNRSAVDAINQAAKRSQGDIIIQISEDFYCFENWGKEIIKATEGKSNFLLKTDDGTQGWIVTLPIMDVEFMASNGWFYCPDYRHMFVDTHLTHLADMTGRLLIRNDIKFQHRHYTTKSSLKDELNVKADATWNQGKYVYLDWVKKQADPFKLSPQAEPHKRWLKQQLSFLS